MKSILVLACLLAVPCVLRAQATSQPPPLPPGPLVRERAPEMAEWVVTKKVGSLNDPAVKPQAGQPALPPGTVQDTITKTGKVIHVRRLNGPQTWNIWSEGAQQVMVWPDGKTAAPLAKSPNADAPNPFYVDFSESDFPGFGWINLEDYTGVTSFNGIKCIVYQKKDTDPGDAPPTMAYVDFETRLPIALQSQGREFLYEWRSAPAGASSPPPEVQGILIQAAKHGAP